MKILVILSMSHSLDIVKKLTSAGHQVAVITLDANSRFTVNLSGYVGRDPADNFGYETFFETDVRLRTVSRPLEWYLSSGDIDIVFCLSWQWIISDEFIERFERGVFGWHGSMFRLPHGFGRSPINWSIRLGGDRIYHTCFQFLSEVDQGPIFRETEISIEEFDHIADMLAKTADSIFNDIIRLTITAPTVYQREVRTPLRFEKLTDLSGELKLGRQDLNDMSRIIRSCASPFPQAYVALPSGQRVRVAEVVRSIEHADIGLEVGDRVLFVKLAAQYGEDILNELIMLAPAGWKVHDTR